MKNINKELLEQLNLKQRSGESPRGGDRLLHATEPSQNHGEPTINIEGNTMDDSLLEGITQKSREEDITTRRQAVSTSSAKATFRIKS